MLHVCLIQSISASKATHMKLGTHSGSSQCQLHFGTKMVSIGWSGCEWLPSECKNAHFQAFPLLAPSVIFSGFEGENRNEHQARQCEAPGRVLEASATASAITNSSSSAQAAFAGGLNSKIYSRQGPPEVPSNSKINPQTPSRTEIKNLINYLKVWSQSDRKRTIYGNPCKVWADPSYMMHMSRYG